MKQKVRVLIEDDYTKEIKHYISFDADSASTRCLVHKAFDTMEVHIESFDASNVLQSADKEVVSIDNAIELYQTYCAASDNLNFLGNPCPRWGDLPEKIQRNWVAVAKRKSTLDNLTKD